MNRRTFFKNVFALGFLGIFTHSRFSCTRNNTEIDEALFYSYKSLIAELAETIIPATDTPGAKDAKVEDFIIKALLNCEDYKTQKKFITGLDDLNMFSIKKYGNPFEKCTLETRIAILGYYESKAISSRILNKIESVLLGTPFITELKKLTVIGFCTSKIGATEVLAYDAIPNHYLGCIPLLPGQKSWATK